MIHYSSCVHFLLFFFFDTGLNVLRVLIRISKLLESDLRFWRFEIFLTNSSNFFFDNLGAYPYIKKSQNFLGSRSIFGLGNDIQKYKGKE